ncbi:MAG: PEP-CTERM sorting domain-containing protein [Burkholderiales bacterium]|nr:PEP-CTERM sorting domain-containing protein [Burkholderiales bacterium]
MKSTFILSLLSSAVLALPAAAAVVQTTGAGSATPGATHLTYAADFDANTSLASPWLEGGLQFTHTGFANDNGGCGYAGENCVDLAAGQVYSQAFSGNYFATAGSNAYLSIRSTATRLNGIEFAVDSGYANIFVMWQTWLNGALTGSGRVSLGAAGVGDVLGLSDAAGFSEVRVYAFDSATDTAGYSVPAIDSVRAFTIPEPGSLALASLAGLGVAGVRRRRRG